MTWSQHELTPDQRAIIEEIEKSPDRAAAIVASALLEDRLTSAILAALEPDENAIGLMFRGSGPVASFGAKINFGYLLGLYPDGFRGLLDVISKIRNAFAHRSKPLDFNHSEIKVFTNRIGSIHTDAVHPDNAENYEHLFEDTSRNRFLFVVRRLLRILDSITVSAALRRSTHGTVWSSLGISSQPNHPTSQSEDHAAKERANPPESSPP